MAQFIGVVTTCCHVKPIKIWEDLEAAPLIWEGHTTFWFGLGGLVAISRAREGGGGQSKRLKSQWGGVIRRAKGWKLEVWDQGSNSYKNSATDLIESCAWSCTPGGHFNPGWTWGSARTQTPLTIHMPEKCRKPCPFIHQNLFDNHMRFIKVICYTWCRGIIQFVCLSTVLCVKVPWLWYILHIHVFW